MTCGWAKLEILSVRRIPLFDVSVTSPYEVLQRSSEYSHCKPKHSFPCSTRLFILLLYFSMHFSSAPLSLVGVNHWHLKHTVGIVLGLHWGGRIPVYKSSERCTYWANLIMTHCILDLQPCRANKTHGKKGVPYLSRDQFRNLIILFDQTCDCLLTAGLLEKGSKWYKGFSSINVTW